MRIVNGLFFVIFILFVAVQYNDPDPLVWGAIYGLGALWAGLAAFRPSAFRQTPVKAAFGLCLIAAFAGVYLYWPQTPEWWTKPVWMEVETAREGMGMMIVALGLIAAAMVARRRV